MFWLRRAARKATLSSLRFSIIVLATSVVKGHPGYALALFLYSPNPREFNFNHMAMNINKAEHMTKFSLSYINICYKHIPSLGTDSGDYELHSKEQ